MMVQAVLNWRSLVARALEVRREEGLTQRELAALAGVTQPTVVKFEKGSTSIRVDSVLAILHALGLAEAGDRTED